MVKSNVGIIIQARMGSSRLPGKVLKSLPYDSKETVLGQIVHRAKAVPNASKLIVATSTQPENDVLKEALTPDDVSLFRGSENNVLERYYLAAKKYKLDTIVRLTADNPCIDPYYISQAIDQHHQAEADYTHTQGLPLGTNVEVIAFSALELIFQKAKDEASKEHVTYYMHKYPEKFKIHQPHWQPQAAPKTHWRLTLDTPSDYAFICYLYEQLYPKNQLFDLKDIAQLITEKPWILDINSHVQQVIIK